MEYQEDAEMSPIPITPDLKPSAQDKHWLGTLTILEQVLTQVTERMGEKPTTPEHGTFTESINTQETDLKIESEQPALIPDMSQIIMPEVQSIEMSMSHFPLSTTKLSVVTDKSQDIILELLMNSMEIYLAQEELSQNKEKLVKSSERKYGKGCKENKLRAPYKDEKSGIESTPKQSVSRPFHYNLPKESLFYKEMMAKAKKTATHAEKQPKTYKQRQPVDEKKEGEIGWKINQAG